ncbi:helix-turn-helix domain-containing protein [Nocardioides yefusunii]|uniref:Helix-turn-helix domain-containing protein n=1 Tax=Nocardioides yefusunii TaxID=2500546 RepID=A0ABW1QXY3_9ACTN|nr:helix-turn-helix domain-containing protein [Nocardioides yefusunii]
MSAAVTHGAGLTSGRPEGAGEPAGWAAFVELMEHVLADETLLPQVVAGVRSMVTEVAFLPVSDMAGHTRALLTAGTRALAGRRGPTEAELAFVEELGVARAAQGIPVDVLLSAVHVSERVVWSRARETAAAAGLPPEVLLDARELYDDWAGVVRSRLIRAHREADAAAAGPGRDRRAVLLRRLLEGGSVAALAAAELGLPSSGVWVAVTRGDGDGGLRRLARVAGETRGVTTLGVRGRVGGALVAVLGAAPASPGPEADVVAVAGPVAADELGAAHRQALAALTAAEAVRRAGVVHVAEVAAVAALLSRPDLEQVLVAGQEGAGRALGPSRAAVARTVRRWAECDRDAVAVAGELFVHPNTVRNRVQRFAEVTDIDPWSALGGMQAWWLARAWDDLEE